MLRYLYSSKLQTMKRIKKVKIKIDDPHFAIRCLDFMNQHKFNEVFYIEKSILQKFLALSLTKGIQFSVIPIDAKHPDIIYNQIWNWKK